MENIKIRKSTTKNESGFDSLSKEELIEKLKTLETHNEQLKNIIAKNNNIKSGSENNNRKFDFSKYHSRHILLRFFYLGWDCQGYTVQDNTSNTIEHYLFKALLKTCLIQSRETSNYNRCGRTDKGVSAFCQVISITVRSKFPKNMQNNCINDEINYCKVLNRVLPNTVQCVGWCPVEENYSARFDCKSRTYKYFFPKDVLNIEAMRNSLTYLVGTHDFRNLCKMDVGHGVINFVRNIISAELKLLNDNPTEQDERKMVMADC